MVRINRAGLGRMSVVAFAAAACSTAPKEPSGRVEQVGVTSEALDTGLGEVVLSENTALTLWRDKVPTDLFETEQIGDRVALGDIDGDGQDEVLRGRQQATVSVFTKTGANFPAAYLNTYFFPPDSEIRTGDVDGDGTDEVILGLRDFGTGSNGTGSNGRLVIVPRPGHSLGSFFPGVPADQEQSIPFYGDQANFTVCDLDGDGFDEIITIPDWHIYSHPSRPQIDLAEFFKNQPGHQPPFLADHARLVCADFNNNHRDDLVVVNPSGPGFDYGDFQFFSEPADGPQVVHNPDPGMIFQTYDRIAAGDLLGNGVAQFVIGHIELPVHDSDPPTYYGPILAYDKDGNVVGQQVFGDHYGTILHDGGDVAIRRRHRPSVDTDGDGLLDDWEVNGIDGDGDGQPDFFLPGADPRRVDVYVEIDGMGCSAGGCSPGQTYTNMPDASIIDPVIAAFANAPVHNPPDVHGNPSPDGVTLHVEYGETLPVVRGCCFGKFPPECPTTPSCFQTTHDASFGTPAERSQPAKVLSAKKLAYHYALFADTTPSPNYAGASLTPIVVAGSPPKATGALRGTPNLIIYNNGNDPTASFMHELGHNLGLLHGGSEEVNRKPNYLSIMNYAYNAGLKDPSKPDRIYDYSRTQLPDLWEVGGPEPAGGLNESKGISDSSDPFLVLWICPDEETSMSVPANATGLDWSCSDADHDGNPNNDAGIVSDINSDGVCVRAAGGKSIASTPGMDDRVWGGFIEPGPDGMLKSAYACSGVSGNDVREGPGNQVIWSGPDGVLDTKICYLGVKKDDFIVYRIDPDPTTGRIDLPSGVSVATTDAPEYNTMGQLIRIRPGNDFTLETGKLAGYPYVPELINPGANGVFDSDYVSAGIQNDDKPFFDPGMAIAAIEIIRVQDTALVGDDFVIGQFIVDGGNRTCDTDVVAPDTAPEAMHKGQTEAADLRGYDDWHHLIYRFDSTANVDEFTSQLNLVELPVDELNALTDQMKSADLGVTISASAGQVNKGSSVSFHVTLANSGPDDAKSALATLKLPTGVVFGSCTSTSGVCGTSGGYAALGSATLAPGATLAADFSVTTDCSTPTGALTASVQASSGIPDRSANNDTASATTQVAAAAPVFLSVPPTVTTTVCTGVQLGTPVAQASCGGSVTVTNNAPTTYPLGRTVVTWTATSGTGTVTATQSVIAKLGDSTTCCPAGSHVILGTASNDTLTGTAGVDCILGRGGQDHISGLGGDDIISGGDGDDVIDGGAGNDRIYGGTGQDNLTGGSGDDLIDGNDGDDIVHAGIGNDTLSGGQGQDQLFGEDGNDSLFGDVGSDTLDGGTGTNYLEGGYGTDTCKGVAATNQFVSCETRPDAPSAGDLCADGTKDGAETAVDCGGGGCHGCAGGGACTLGSDCLSQVCAGGVCTAPSSPLVVSLTVTSDWGPAYCAQLNAYNSGATATTAWTATLDTKGTTIYQTTKGTFTPASGIVTAAPQTTELVVAPGATNTNVTFCANRPSGNTTSVAVLSSSSGNY